MTDALEDHEGPASIGGRTIKNLRFADEIDALARKEEELFKLVNQLDKASTTYGMKISAEKTKSITINTRGISSDIRLGGQNLETVQSFKCLVSVMTDEESKQKILSRIAQTVGALSKLKTMERLERQEHFPQPIRMMSSLVISIFLCETWTLTAELKGKTQVAEMRCFRRLLSISFKDHVTNEEVRNTIRHAIGPYEDLIITVRKRKMRWYGHITR